MAALAAHDDEVAVVLLLLLRDQHPRVVAFGGRLQQPPGRKAGLRGQRGELALRRVARLLALAGDRLFGHAGSTPAALEGHLDGVHQHQRCIGRDAVGNAHRLQAPGREVHRHQHAAVRPVHRLPHHQHRPLCVPGDTLGHGAEDDAARESAAARAGDEQFGVEPFGQARDLPQRMSHRQVFGNARAMAALQLGGQGMQPRAGIVLDGLRIGRVAGATQFVERARGQGMHQRQLRIVRARQQGGAVAGIARRRRQIGGDNDVQGGSRGDRRL